MLTLHDGLRLVLLTVPVDADSLASILDELISAATAGICQERAEVFLFLEWLDLGGSVLVINATFSSISVDIGHFVDAQGMLLVERHQIQLPYGRLGFSSRGVLDERKSAHTPC